MKRKQDLPAILWAFFILILCGIPGRDIPHISFLEMLSFDKWVHAGVFFVLVLLTVRGFRLRQNSAALKKHASWFALAFCIPYGGLLEIMQGTLFEERSMDVYDFIADSFGALLAVLFYKTLSSKIKFLHQPQ